ncbi:hypothetical protein B0F90DRAFT_1811958 [Multifurca ochricompacta]|uniref:DUF2421 domain-containing protein n=1 Tax=Multifurca ochricompacta TaxID=376703 RepID=A0AAD4LW22_9AGAM|nr:hypothetical protein B0F90DRAFT_1811958 [Multifurca ochricompacta]
MSTSTHLHPREYDPRIGDEDASRSDPPDNAPPNIPSSSHAFPAAPKQESNSNCDNLKGKVIENTRPNSSQRARSSLLRLPANLRWIVDNWKWSKWMPAIRCAISEWVSLLLLIINPSTRSMGQASFLILIAGMLSPPGDPFVANTEREIIILVFVLVSWGWASLGIKLSALARTYVDYSAHINDILSGKYLEVAPSIINVIFLFFGSAFFLYVKAQQGPGPFVPATTLACICLGRLCTSYLPGKAVIVPVAFHSAVAIASSVLVFPTSIAAKYTAGLRGVINPLSSGFRQHISLLETSTSSSVFSPKAVRASASKAESALAPLNTLARLLKRDISWGRFSGMDLDGMREKVQRLVMRAHGMNVYFYLIDPTRERFPVTPVPSHPGSPSAGTPNVSRPSSPARTEESASASPVPPHSTTTCSQAEVEQYRGRQALRRHPRFDVDSTSHSVKSHSHGTIFRSLRHTHRHSHISSLFGIHHQDNLREHVVGVFESQRYLDLESHHFAHPLAVYYTGQSTALLRQSCEPLLRECIVGLGELDLWLSTSRNKRWMFWFGGDKSTRERQERLDGLYKAGDELTRTLATFRASLRHLVLEPYREAFSDKHEGCMTGGVIPPHRFLFHTYTYQYHLMEFSIILISTLEYITNLEKERLKTRLWLPTVSFYDFFRRSIWDDHVNLEHEDDENPNVIQGKEGLYMDMGIAQRRDPDALPPRNTFEVIMNVLYHAFQGLSRGNQLFAIKAGILTALLSIPSFVKSSAALAYGEHFSWAIFMGQLTLARFCGDTTFGLVARIMSTFAGGLTGAAVWHISTGAGTGNPYGLAAICVVIFPFFFYARLYWPGPPVPNTIFFTTAALVIGYSWQNTHYQFGKFLYYGINLAWRRFVLVCTGVSAAFIFSFLPPSTTLRDYQRQSLATSASEIGAVYCSIVSYASSPQTEDPQHLKRSIVLRANIIYEFSLRGRWPAERYQKILEILLEIAYLLSHLMSVVQHLEPAWTRAFLRRTRFLDPDFQGDVLGVISMISTALRTGTPLPQVTPCPLLDRFIFYHHGLNIIRNEADDDYGLPRTMSIDVLENEQYMCFCVGVSTSFGIVTRFDRLMHATKELVGEQYHIHGVGHISKVAAVDMGSRTNSLRPIHDA